MRFKARLGRWSVTVHVHPTEVYLLPESYIRRPRLADGQAMVNDRHSFGVVSVDVFRSGCVSQEWLDARSPT